VDHKNYGTGSCGGKPLPATQLLLTSLCANPEDLLELLVIRWRIGVGSSLGCVNTQQHHDSRFYRCNGAVRWSRCDPS
jgi:hypothetical protein